MSRSAEHRRAAPSNGLGGADAFGLAHWLLTLLPASLLVLASEVATPGTTAAQILVSAVLQHAAAGAVGLPIAHALRRRGTVLSLPAAAGVWTAIGIVRGATGAAVAAAGGVDPSTGPRLLLWVTVSVLWTPLLGHLVTQATLRRSLLRALTEAEAARDDARSRAGRTAEEVRSQLLHTISEAVFPAVREIRNSLARVAHPVDEGGGLGRIGERLTSLTATVGGTVERLADPARPLGSRLRSAPAPVGAALHFERRRPMQWAAVSGGAVLATTIPLALQAGRGDLVPALLIAVAAGAAVLALGPGLPQRAIRQPHAMPLVPLRYLAGSAVSGLVLLALPARQLDPFPVLLAAILPLGLLLSAALFSIGVGTADANRALRGTIGLVEADRVRQEERAREREDRVRTGLRAVLHGPIQGRLAACAMAINFHAAGSVPGDAEAVARAVLGHLALVEQDLAALEDEVLARGRACAVPVTAP